MNTGYHLFKLGKLIAKEIEKCYEEKTVKKKDLSKHNITYYNLTEFANPNLSELESLLLISKYNSNGQIDEYFEYYFTYAQYYMFLDSNSISNRKTWRWKKFVFKDFNEQKGLNEFKNFIQMFDYESQDFSYNIWKTLSLKKENYFRNDVVARFEKEYTTTDFAAERHAKCNTPLLDKICNKFGEEKGNNLCAAVFSYVELGRTVIEHSSDKELCYALWGDFFQNKIKEIYGEQGVNEFLETMESSKPFEELEKEILAINPYEYTCASWMRIFQNSHWI